MQKALGSNPSVSMSYGGARVAQVGDLWACDLSAQLALVCSERKTVQQAAMCRVPEGSSTQVQPAWAARGPGLSDRLLCVSASARGLSVWQGGVLGGTGWWRALADPRLLRLTLRPPMYATRRHVSGSLAPYSQPFWTFVQL